MKGRSISFRLTLWFSSVLFVGLALFAAAMWFTLDGTLTSARSRTLDRRADRLKDLLDQMRQDPPEQRARKFQAFADATGGGLIEVFNTDGSPFLPSPSSAARAFPWPSPAPLQAERFREVAFSGQPYRVLARPYSSELGRLVLLVAAPLEGSRQVLRTFAAGLLWTIPALLALSALGGYGLSRRALKPVDQIAAAARSITVSNLSERLPVPRTADELQRLAETFNAMLARLESAVNEIQRFTADASHELRSPLSFVRTVAELARRNPQADARSRQAFQEIIEESGKAARLLEDMLTLARADSPAARPAFEPVDLAEVARSVFDRALSLANAHRHVLTFSLDGGSAALVYGDFPTLQRLLWILLENAVKYTPSPGAIRLSLSATQTQAQVTVQDNGIGIAAADLPHIFKRFYRADPSRGQVEGSGLGLAIAKWIADIHQARLSVESSENRGALFRIVFPAYAPTPAPLRAPAAGTRAAR
ncbi:MAG TPA: ATP-binding protein [Bryobacteraceae bacterium]|nr:ATP-binding protein [Bryobacteraceae bacterium]